MQANDSVHSDCAEMIRCLLPLLLDLRRLARGHTRLASSITFATPSQRAAAQLERNEPHQQLGSARARGHVERNEMHQCNSRLDTCVCIHLPSRRRQRTQSVISRFRRKPRSCSRRRRRLLTRVCRRRDLRRRYFWPQLCACTLTRVDRSLNNGNKCVRV